MIFHVKSSEERGFAPTRSPSTGSPEYHASWIRVFLGILLLALLLGGALLSKRWSWPEGSSALLHMAEVSFGGLAGLFFGERTGITSK